MNIEQITTDPIRALHDFNEQLVGALRYHPAIAEETNRAILGRAAEHACEESYQDTLKHLVYNYIHTMETELHNLFGDHFHLLEREEPSRKA